MKNYWCSSKMFTIWVLTTDDLRIVNTAPVAKIFIGQNLVNLLEWMRADKWEELDL